MFGLNEKLLEDFKEKFQEFLDKQDKIDEKLDEVLKLLKEKKDNE